MSRPTGAPTVTRSIEIDADPDAVYALVTDVAVLADLADETTTMTWRHGSSAAPGAVFTGANRNGLRRWSTRCTVTDAEPGQVFGFDVAVPFPPTPVSHWRYELVATTTGCRVTESTWDRRPSWFRLPARLATGVVDRAEANARHIDATLARLRERAESRG